MRKWILFGIFFLIQLLLSSFSFADYWIFTDANNGLKMYKIDLSSSNPTPILFYSGVSQYVSYDWTDVWYVNSGNIYKKNINDTNTTNSWTLFLSSKYIWGLTSDSDNIYYIATYSWGSSMFKKAKINTDINSIGEIIATTNVTSSLQFYYSNNYLYIIGYGRYVYRKTTGKDPLQVVINDSFPKFQWIGFFTVDNNNIYWVRSYENNIRGEKMYYTPLNSTFPTYTGSLFYSESVYSGAPWFTKDGYLYFSQNGNGSFVYKKNINSTDTSTPWTLFLSKIVGTFIINTLTTNTSTTLPTTQYPSTYTAAYAGSTYQIAQNNNALIFGNGESVFMNALNQGKYDISDKNGNKIQASNEADPVNLSNGEFTYNNTFMQIPGIKNPYEFALTYRNQFSYDGPVGNKFDHNYNIFLTESGSTATLYNGKLGIFDFTLSGSTYEYNKGLKANLTKTNGIYTLTFDTGTKYIFDATSLKITKSIDRYGNTIHFAYNSDKQLTTVTDELGRTITYTYGTNSRLQKVMDFNGRNTTLAYYSSSDTNGTTGDLKSVTIASGSGSSAPSKTISFTYTGSHNIATLVDSKGQTYVSNTYDANNRVTSQTYGSGTTNYSYTLSGSIVATNTVTNALGIKTKYTYDSNGNTTQREIYDSTGGLSTIYKYEYDTNARLIKIIYPRGNGIAYTYDDRGNITEKREKSDANSANTSADLITTMSYDRVYDIPLQITAPNGLIKAFTLDGSGNILSEASTGITNPDGTSYGTTKTYTYTPSGLLATSTDTLGNISQYGYLSGQLATLTHSSGSEAFSENFSYNDYGNILTSTDGEGNTKNFLYTDWNLLGTGTTAEWIQTRYTYDVNNNKTHEEKYSSSGGIVAMIDYGYDVLDHITKKTEWIDANTSRVTNMTYDSVGNLLTTQTGTGAKTKYTYDEMGHVKEVRILVDTSDASKDIVTTATFDRNGNTISSTDALGNTTSMTYDLFDRMIQKTDALENYTTYSYDASGNITETKSYNSLSVLLSQTTAEYDLLGHVIRTTLYNLTDSGNNIVNTASYDSAGNIVSTTDARGSITTNSYDAFGRFTKTTDALGNTTSSTYDKRNLVTSKTLSSSGSIYGTTTSYSYDNDGRLTEVTDANGGITTSLYDAEGNILSVTDAKGNTTTRTYDFLGRVLTEKKTLTGTENHDVVTSYTYDTLGNVLTLTDAKGNVTSYAYDSLGRKIRETLPDGNVTFFTYDKVNNVVNTTDANGTITANTYNTLGQLSSRAITTAIGVLGTTSEAYSYDALGRLVSATSSGTTTGTGVEVNTLGFTYDSQNHLLSEIQNSVPVSYTYDQDGNRLSVTSGTGYSVTSAYDVLNRITEVAYNSGVIANYSYSGIVLDHIGLGNGVTTSYEYDSLLRMNSLNHSNASGLLAGRTFVYDGVGNILSDGQRNYSYDSLYRLTSATSLSGVIVPNSAESFGYDLMGSRVTSSSSSGVLSATYSGNILNQYLSVTVSGSSVSGATSLTYDKAGNLNSNGIYVFSYDYKNRLVLVKKTSDNSLVAQYGYDVLGRRIMKTSVTSGVTSGAMSVSQYVYAGENAIREIVSVNGVIHEMDRIYGSSVDDLLAYETDDSILADGDTQEYLFCSIRVNPFVLEFGKYGYGNLVQRCGSLASEYNTTVRKMFFVHKDQLGSTIALTNDSGALVQSYAYDVYGSPYVWVNDGSSSSGSSGSGSSSSSGSFVALKDFVGNLHGNDRFFTGREYNSEVALYYNRARFYSPTLGRFISRDPIGMKDDVNLYGYVGENPVNSVDRMGREKKVLQSVVNYMNYYWAYLQNNPVFANEFSKIVLDPTKMNFKLQEWLLEKSEWIDVNCTNLSNNCWKKITINNSDITLSELWNIGFWYIGQKYGYSKTTLHGWAFLATIPAWMDGYKKDGIIHNEQEDSKYYDIWYNLGENTKTGGLTVEELRNAVLSYKNQQHAKID